MEKNTTLKRSICKGTDATEKRTLNYRKGRKARQAKQGETLEPTGTESGYYGYVHVITNGQTIPGSKMAPTASELSKLRNLVTRMCSSSEVRSSREQLMAQAGEDVSKSESLPAMGRTEADALT